MRRSGGGRAVCALLAASAVLLAARAARAQAGQADASVPDASGDGPSTADAGAHVMSPPVAIEMPPIDVPPGAAPPTATVEVGVILTIDAAGAVTAVEVVHSGGEALDRAVVEGAKRFRFQPAMQDGVGVAVRVPFTQRFEPPPPPPPPPAPAQPELDAVIEGIVVTRGTRRPVIGATVAAREAGTTEAYLASTDSDGIFVLPVRSGPALEVRISAAEHEKFVQREQLAKGERLKVKYLLDRKTYGQYESYVRAETDRTEVSRTTLSGPELTRVPGTFGDPFRVINLLPGVTSVMGLLPLPIVRGTSPGDTGTLLDGIRLPLLFHLLAGPSVVHPEFIDHVDFYPGGFPVTYGGYIGGIIDGVTRAARPDEHLIDIDLNLTQTGVLVREPVAALGLTETVAARIGYPGIILGLLVPTVSLSYWDYQARLDGRAAGGKWTVFAFGAQDVLQQRSSTSQPFTTLARFEFHRLDLRYLHGDLASNELYRVTFGYDDTSFGDQTTQVTGDAGLGNGTWSVNPQARVHRTPAAWLELNFGVESYDHTVNNPPVTTTTLSANGMNLAQLFNPNGFYTESGAFVEAVLRPTARLRLIPGIRGDLYDEQQSAQDVSQWSVDPRLLARYRLTDTEHGSIWLKGVVGRYHQPPRLFIPIPGLEASSLGLGLLASTQYSVGVEAKLGPAVDIDVNTYYNSMDPVLFDLTVNPTATDVQQPQPAFPPWQLPTAPAPERNQVLTDLFARRSGRSYGLEVLLRKRATDNLFGWVSYTLSRSERSSPQGWQLFDFDRLHVLNLVTGLRLPRNWELGTRVLFQTGTPLTTIYGTNSARSDSQFRVDLRLDKRAVWNRWLLDFYVDIINTTVAAESGGLLGASSVRYVIPTIGVRGVL